LHEKTETDVIGITELDPYIDNSIVVVISYSIKTGDMLITSFAS